MLLTKEIFYTKRKQTLMIKIKYLSSKKKQRFTPSGESSSMG